MPATNGKIKIISSYTRTCMMCRLRCMTAMQCTHLVLRCEMANVLDSPCKDGGHFLPLGRRDDCPQVAHEMGDFVPVPLQQSKVPCNDEVMTFTTICCVAHCGLIPEALLTINRPSKAASLAQSTHQKPHIQ